MEELVGNREILCKLSTSTTLYFFNKKEELLISPYNMNFIFAKTVLLVLPVSTLAPCSRTLIGP